MSSVRLPRFASLVVFAIGLTFASPAFTTVLPVSPGAADRVVETTSACPAFSWSGVDDAIAFEIVVLDVGDAENPLLVYSRRIEGAALAWAPSREECLAPGRVYAWLVRADVAGAGLGEWSAPRRFRVPGVPSIEEVDAALALLERWRVAQPGVLGSASGSPAISATGQSTPAGGDRATAETEAPLAAGVAAVRGEIPDVTGNAYGVFGITSSPQGAGVVARNQSTGADLILDGEAQGEPDTLLTQSGLDRPSASGATFNLQNSGAGALTLQVDGVAVSKEGHAHAGEAITTGTVADARVASTLARDTEVLSLVLAGDGGGSTLDADLLDGTHASSFATSAHGHAGEAITSGTVADARIASTLTRDSEVMPTVLAGDGADSGLDADYLDGASSASFANAVHSHIWAAWLASDVPFVLRLQNSSADGAGLLVGNYQGNGLVASGAGAQKAGVEGVNNDPNGRGVYGLTQGTLGFGVFGEASSLVGSASGVYGTSASPDGLGGYFHHYSGGGALFVEGNGAGRNLAALRVENNLASTGIAAYVTNSSAVATAHFANSGAGEVLYLQNGGTDSFGTGGNDFIRAVNNPENDSQFRVLTDGEVRSDAGFNTPAADFAEMLPAAPGLEPGDVLAIGRDGKLVRSSGAFAPNVAGVHSTAPGFVGGHPVDGDPPGDRVPLAVVGIVPVKVSAENGPIAPGDLLVAAGTPGHAMRAGGFAPNGTVLGKALEPHAAGLGRIRVLVVLQ